MHDTHVLAPSIQTGLGIYYLILVGLNVGYSAYQFLVPRNRSQAFIWGGVALLFLIHAGAYKTGNGWIIPMPAREAVDRLMGAVSYFVISVA